MAYVVELPVGESGGPPCTVGVEIEQVGDGLVEVARPGRGRGACRAVARRDAVRGMATAVLGVW